MENLELMSMTSFVKMQSDKMFSKIQERVGEPKYTVLQFITEVPNYADFLTQELEVGMMVPMDNEGNLLMEPHSEESVDFWNEGCVDEGQNAKYGEWEEAKKKCLFLIDDYEDGEDVVFMNNRRFMISKETGLFIFGKFSARTVEELANCPDITLYLSPAALKKIGI
ncbi:hypothetical protein C1637_09860 [Chryseobacterium lactis]|uniref:Uncharacterized protein n=1 Tax=Chryseobacterium lactis TaxID=1241981 RepID=A0A3G6RCR8_CHRLC|nr:hypothetical protein [Chryseobacterium lactis]AZA82184.1 hypothetical protein EG342_09840 [Chryseobacterium lactis]AZB02565.1 hypothetical protein EG341_00695 [Chryseobacterium lactis]PNW14140.1 hypothetical protein C1637_09860 [Chryseobacterium lactis]